MSSHRDDDAPRAGLPRRTDQLTGYIEPTSEAEAEERVRELTYSIQVIETHLGDKTPPAPHTRRATDPDRWRLDARVAHQSKSEEKRRLLLWIKRARRARQEECGRLRGLLRGLYQLLMGPSNGEELTEAEQAVVEDVERYLKLK